MSDELDIQRARNADGSARLTVVGEIDIATAPEFRRALADVCRTHPAIELDLRGVTYFDSAGLDALFMYATKHRIKLSIGENRTLAAVIRVTGLAQVLTVDTGT